MFLKASQVQIKDRQLSNFEASFRANRSNKRKQDSCRSVCCGASCFPFYMPFPEQVLIWSLYIYSYKKQEKAGFVVIELPRALSAHEDQSIWLKAYPYGWDLWPGPSFGPLEVFNSGILVWSKVCHLSVAALVSTMYSLHPLWSLCFRLHPLLI